MDQKNFLAFSKKSPPTGSSASPLASAKSSSFLRCSGVRWVGTSTCTRTSGRRAGLSEGRHAPPFQANVVPDCVPVGILSDALPDSVGTSMLPHKCRERELDRDFAEQIVALALRRFRGLDVDDDVQVAAGSAIDSGLAVAD